MTDNTVSIEAERALLGALMSHPDAASTLPHIESNDFSVPEFAKIYQAITHLLERGKATDPVSVYEYMRERGEADLPLLVEIANAAYSHASTKRYAEVLLDKSLRRRIKRFATDLIDHAVGNTPTETLVEISTSGLYQAVSTGGSKEPVDIRAALREHTSELERRCEAHQAGRTNANATGLPDLDKLLGGGMRPGELIVVAGRPGMGKTAFATGIALHQAMHGLSVMLLSQEMSASENMDRIVSLRSGIAIEHLRSGNMQQGDWGRVVDAIESLSSARLFIDDQGGISMGEVRAKARKMKMRSGLHTMVVDYLQLMSGEGENRTQQIGYLSRALKALAMELGITVIALSQLNRGVESRADRRPTMADLRESGSIEADADIILMLYRDEVYNPSTTERGVSEIIVAKHRNGPTGTLHVGFDGARGRFFCFAVPYNVAPKQVDRPSYAIGRKMED